MWYDKLYYFAVLERGFFLMSSPKLTVAVLFGGASTEHDVSQLSVTSVLRELDRDKYELLPVGITRSGEWFLYTGSFRSSPMAAGSRAMPAFPACFPLCPPTTG